MAEESEKLIPLMPKDDAEERAKKWVETEKAFEVYLKEDLENDDDKVTILKNRAKIYCFKLSNRRLQIVIGNNFITLVH